MMTDEGITEVNKISNAKKMITNEAVLLEMKVFSNYLLFKKIRFVGLLSLERLSLASYFSLTFHHISVKKQII